MKQYKELIKQHKKCITQVDQWSSGTIDTKNHQPFPKYERAKRVSEMHQLSPSNLVGQHWNHSHLDALVRVSRKESQTSQPRLEVQQSSGKYPPIKNVCRYGFTNVMPLVKGDNCANLSKLLNELNVQVRVPEREQSHDDSIERPLNPKERLLRMRRLKEKLDDYQSKKSKLVGRLRLKQILQGQYPHGISGIENPQSQQRSYCGSMQRQLNFRQTKRTRVGELYNKFNRSTIFDLKADCSQFPKQSFELSPMMKSKRHLHPNHTPQKTNIGKRVPSFHEQRSFNIISNTMHS